jgi:hypothetical protein
MLWETPSLVIFGCLLVQPICCCFLFLPHDISIKRYLCICLDESHIWESQAKIPYIADHSQLSPVVGFIIISSWSCHILVANPMPNLSKLLGHSWPYWRRLSPCLCLKWFTPLCLMHVW